jgi:tetratricopeptide (TPR) repeat protein
MLAGTVPAKPARCAEASRNDGAEFVQIAQTFGDVIACRSSPSRHCILELALAAAEETDEESSTYHALVAISEAQAKAGDFEAAAATMDRIGTLYSKPSPRVNLAQLMAEGGRYDAARAMAERIVEADDRALASLMIGEAATKAGRFDLAQSALEASLATAASLPNDLQWRAFILELAEAWAPSAAASADRAMAPVIVKAIGAASTEADREQATALLAAVHAAAGEIDEAAAALQTVHDPDLFARVQTRMAKAQGQSGDVVGARARFNAVLAKIGRIQSRDSRDVIRSRAAAFFAANHDVRAAMAIIDTMEDNGFRRDWLMRIIDENLAGEDREFARDLIAAVLRSAQRIDDAQSRALTLWSVARAQAKIGEVLAARESIAAALAAVRRIEDTSLRAMVYANFGAMLDRAGFRDESPASFDAALATAEGIADVGMREMAMLSIAKRQAEVGNFAAARSTIEHDATNGGRDIVLVSIAEGQGRAGKVVAALATADEIEDPRSRVEAFTRIANQLSQ